MAGPSWSLCAALRLLCIPADRLKLLEAQPGAVCGVVSEPLEPAEAEAKVAKLLAMLCGDIVDSLVEVEVESAAVAAAVAVAVAVAAPVSVLAEMVVFVAVDPAATSASLVEVVTSLADVAPTSGQSAADSAAVPVEVGTVLAVESVEAPVAALATSVALMAVPAVVVVVAPATVVALSEALRQRCLLGRRPIRRR